jgi:hypothetical protein
MVGLLWFKDTQPGVKWYSPNTPPSSLEPKFLASLEFVPYSIFEEFSLHMFDVLGHADQAGMQT